MHRAVFLVFVQRDTIGQVEPTLCFNDVPEHREHISIFLVNLEFNFRFVSLEVFFVHLSALDRVTLVSLDLSAMITL